MENLNNQPETTEEIIDSKPLQDKVTELLNDI
jgi:hypothetical protein